MCDAFKRPVFSCDEHGHYLPRDVAEFVSRHITFDCLDSSGGGGSIHANPFKVSVGTSDCRAGFRGARNLSALRLEALFAQVILEIVGEEFHDTGIMIRYPYFSVPVEPDWVAGMI